MTTDFLHGVEVLEIDAGPRPIRTVRSGVIGIVGTAPDAAPAVAATLTLGRLAANTQIVLTAATPGLGGNAISVRLLDPGAPDAALAVSVTQKAIAVTLATDDAGALTSSAGDVIAALNDDPDASALVSAANAPGSTGAGTLRATDVARFLSSGENEPFPLNTPSLIAGSRQEAAKLDATGAMAGTLPAALDGILDQAGAVVVVVRVEEGDDAAETRANVIGGVNAVTGAYEGVHALLGAENALGFAPRILCAPGFTHQRQGTANPVVAEMIAIAERLRAIIVADGPNSTDEAAIEYREDWGSDRVYVVDPFVLVSRGGVNTAEPASARVAGVIARTDNDRGFWVSPSNKAVNGIVGLARDVEFQHGDKASRANLLNEQEVTTIVRHDGFVLWGNRTASRDPKFAFLSVRRTADMINDSIKRAHMWAIDRNITRTFVEDVVESVNAYIRTLTALEAILGGECYPDPDLNTPAAMQDGRVYLNVVFSPPYPAERITFRSQIVDTYLAEVFA